MGVKPFFSMNKENLLSIFKEIENGNNYGEKITLVGATKYIPVEDINEAISLGLKDVGENKPQEFRDKIDSLLPVNYHFFGRLQKNKVKYLIGKCYLIHSVDSLELLEEINRQSEKSGIIQNVLIEVNVGDENKTGFSYNELENILNISKSLKNVCVKGFMAMLKDTDSEEELVSELTSLRKNYDFFKEKYDLSILSVGMSNDYQLAIKHGSNMIRVGTKIFGRRY